MGSISYRAHEKVDGYKLMEVVIIASFIEKAELTAKDPIAAEVAQVAEAMEG